MAGKPSPKTVSTKIGQIAKLAKQMPGTALTSLSHHIDVDWLREAHRRTRKDGAPGVDRQTADEYASNLEENLRSLLDRAKSADRYRAPPVRRVHIPKGDGSKTRPIGIPTFEDKILQRAVVMALEAVYEQDFVDCSFGFRRGRSAHQALHAVWSQLTEMKGGWVLEADIAAFFDSVDHGLLQQILRRRVRDGVLLRLIGKWLNAGVMEEGCVYHPEAGAPQGGVISPLLANIFLHEVLDEWFEHEVKPQLMSRAFLVRYADDFVMAFMWKGDAQRVMDLLSKRFEKYGLRLHPEKTRLVCFDRPARATRNTKGPASFDLLGFRHYWARSRQDLWVVKRKTVPSRLVRAVARVDKWCRDHRHEPLAQQHRQLESKLRGHYNYYGVIGNGRSLQAFQFLVTRVWFRWLRRRSRARPDWNWMNRMLGLFPLPRPSTRPVPA
jgi:RNA-directed DNA polymerase